MDFKFIQFFKNLQKIGARGFFWTKNHLEFLILALALKYWNWSCYMSPTFTVTSQKVKVYLLSSSNYRSKT